MKGSSCWLNPHIARQGCLLHSLADVSACFDLAKKWDIRGWCSKIHVGKGKRKLVESYQASLQNIPKFRPDEWCTESHFSTVRFRSLTVRKHLTMHGQSVA